MTTALDLSGLAIDRSRQPKARRRRHLLTRYILPAVLLAGFVSLVAWAAWDLIFPPRQVTVVPVVSATVKIRQEGTPLFKAAGWIEPRPTPVRVAALAPGIVSKLLVVEDQPVKAGEPIAELVKEDAKLALDRALADLQLRQAEAAAAKATLKAAKTRFQQPVHLEATLAEAEASLAQIATQLDSLPFQIRRAKADQRATQKDYESKLAAKKAIAIVQIEYARSKFESSEALVDELRNRTASLKKELAALKLRRDALKTQLKLLADEIQAKEEAEARLNAAKARLAQARVTVDQAKLQLERMTVRTPVDGRVYRLIGHPGAEVGRGMFAHAMGYDSSTVVTLYRPDMLQVRVDVRFEDIPKVSLRQPVKIDNPALPSPLTGKVLFISSEADIQKNTLQVKVHLENPPPVFKPEMLVDVTFLAPKQAGSSQPSQALALYVPDELVRQGADGPFVWVADQSTGVARKTAVETATVGSDGLVEIVSGLTVSSRIIDRGGDGIRDGERIRVIRE